MGTIKDSFLDSAQRDENLRILNEFARSNRHRLYLFILRRLRDPAEAEELTQQTFLEAVKGIDGFRAESELTTWLYGIAAKLVINYFCRSPRWNHQWETDEALEFLCSPDEGPDSQINSKQVVTRLQEHLAALPAEMRETALAVAVDDLSYPEAAELMQIPVGTVRSRIFRARSILRERMAADGIDCANWSV